MTVSIKVISSLFLLVLTLNISNTLLAKTTPELATAKQMMTNQPVKIQENRGQMIDMDGNPVDFVLFKMKSSGLDFYITETGLTYTFKKFRKELIPEEELTAYDKRKTVNQKLTS